MSLLHCDKELVESHAFVVDMPPLPQQSTLLQSMELVAAQERESLPFDPKAALTRVNVGRLMDGCESAHMTSSCHDVPSTVPSDDLTCKQQYLVRAFEPFNEVEYSAEMTFSQWPNIDLSDEAVRCGDRAYYKRKIRVNLPKGHGTKKMEAILRIDNAPSAKLKVVKRKLNVGGMTVSWTAAIEIPLKRLKRIEYRAKNATKKLDIIHWRILFRLPHRSLLFRVAFRNNAEKAAAGKEGAATCNIECENKISAELFGLIFHMLASYYKLQYERYDRINECFPKRIRPIDPTFPLTRMYNLTEEQRYLAERATLCTPEFDKSAEGMELAADEADSVEPAAQIASLTEYLGIGSYLKYSEDNTRVVVDADNMREYLRPKTELEPEEFALDPHITLLDDDDRLIYLHN